ncbi:MAG: hypothetical protein ACLQPH_17350 [Acidimicrobiales bacterium]
MNSSATDPTFSLPGEEAPDEEIDPEHDANKSGRPSRSGDKTSVAAVTTDPEESAVIADPEEDRAASSGRRAARSWPAFLISAALVALALTWGGWLISGGGLYLVGSPSMGMVAPVGSLVATQPLSPSAVLRVGEIVVFEPHAGRSLTYVHRIYQILPRGEYLTKGDLNQGPDPWVITRSDIVGTPQAIIPAVGWIYKCATWLFLGAAALFVVALYVGERQRRWILALGPAVLLAVPLLLYRPLIGGFLFGSGRRGRMVAANIIDTGILPVHFTPTRGGVVHAVPGQEVLVTGWTPKHPSVLHIRISAALPWWGWVLVILACLIPLILVAVNAPLRRPMRIAAEAAAGQNALEADDPDPIASQAELMVLTDESTPGPSGKSDGERQPSIGPFPRSISVNGNVARVPLRRARSQVDLPPCLKRCSRCTCVLPLDAFGKHKGKCDGLSSRCRKCNAEVARQRRSATALDKI